LLISCIVPIFNEQAVIENFIRALHEKLLKLSIPFEILVIDDGSSDQTYPLLIALSTQFKIKVIRFSRNFGKESALTAGLKHCKGDVTILMDCDFQHPLSLLDTFLEKWTEGYDMVYGVQANRKHETFFKRSFTQLFYRLMRSMTKTDIPPHAGDFRLLDKKVVQALLQLPEKSRFMKGLYAWVGFASFAVPFEAPERSGGKSAWNFSRLTELALTGLTAFSDVPLRIWGLIGLIISTISFAYGLLIIFDTLLYGVDVPGYATIVVAIMFFGGIQLLSIGILGEYIGRIFTEVKNRPNYIIEQQIGFDE
jgi:polyisoprenyl-phosphate glycosyltransferase